MKQSFPEALKGKQGIQTQASFAEGLNIDQSTLSRIVNGKRGNGWIVLANIFALYPDLLPFFVSDYANINQ